MARKKRVSEDLKGALEGWPIVKHIYSKTLAQDIKGFDPNNPKDVEEWGNIFRGTFEKMKADLAAKGIPMPSIVIDSTPGPITYAVKTVDKDGNVLHSQP